MKILVTGGAGFIGSHTIVELINAGYDDIVVIDNLSNSKREVLDRIAQISGKTVTFHQMDLLDHSELDTLFRQYDFEAVIHFAGLKAVGESVLYPLKYYQNNVTGTINLLEMMQTYGVKKIVFSSSCTVYGDPQEIPVTEKSLVRPVNPYGRTKWMIEQMLTDQYHADPDWEIIMLRYFNPVGAHPSGLIGEDPNGIPNNLFPFVTRVLAGKLDRLNIFGGDYPTRDGTAIRDYIHVVDLAIGHVLALRKLNEKKGIRIVNLGTGKGYTVLEVVKTFEKVSGLKVPFDIVDRRPGDAAIVFADPGLAWTESNGRLSAICNKCAEMPGTGSK